MRVSLFSTSTVLVHSGFSTGPPPPPRSPREGGTPIDRHGHGGVHAKRPGIIDMELPHRRRQRRRGPDHQPAKAHLAMSALPFGNSGSQCGTMLPVCRRQNKNTPSCAGIKTQKNSSVEPGPPAVRQQQADARPHANATRGARNGSHRACLQRWNSRRRARVRPLIEAKPTARGGATTVTVVSSRSDANRIKDSGKQSLPASFPSSSQPFKLAKRGVPKRAASFSSVAHSRKSEKNGFPIKGIVAVRFAGSAFRRYACRTRSPPSPRRRLQPQNPVSEGAPLPFPLLTTSR